MKNLILIILLGFSLGVKGQFAIIKDKDGFVNIRNESKTGNNIIDTLNNGHLIYCFEDNGNWTNIDYNKNGKELNGYLYKDRYSLISIFQEIPISKKNETEVKLGKDTIEITITRGAFDKTKHKLKYFRDNKDQIELIDNKKYWGTDGGLPKTEYKSISIKIGSQNINLPPKAIENLFEPFLYNTAANYDNTTNTLYIQSMNSDGAGGYFVIWKIVNGIYKERYIAYGF